MNRLPLLGLFLLALPATAAATDPDPDDLLWEIPRCSAVYRHGSPGDKINIVFAGEGYTWMEQPKYYDDVHYCLSYLLNTQPFKDRLTDFNVWRINSISRDSGIDDYPTTGVKINTCFDAGWTNDDYDLDWSHANLSAAAGVLLLSAGVDLTSDPHLFIILFNVSGQDWTGRQGHAEMGGTQIWMGTYRGAAGINLGMKTIHEFGHVIGELDEEYLFDDSRLRAYNGADPVPPNLSSNTSMNDPGHKWGDLVGIAGVQPCVPGLSNEGAILGGTPYDFGIWRAAPSACVMNSPQDLHQDSGFMDFCPVCQRAMRAGMSDRAGLPLNRPPENLQIDLSATTVVGTNEVLTLTVDDPDGDEVRFDISGALTSDETTPFVSSGEPLQRTVFTGYPGVYEYTITALDSGGLITQRINRSIIVANKPERLTLAPLHPAHGASVLGKPVLSWNVGPEPVPPDLSYEIQLTGDFATYGTSTPQFDVAHSALSFTNGGTYSWKVRARRGTRYSPWYGPFSFTIQGLYKTASDYPMLVSPANGAEDLKPWISGSNLVLNWTNPTRYAPKQWDVTWTEVGSTPNVATFTNPGLTSCAIPLSAITQGRVYTWSVTVYEGTTARQSNSYSFAYGLPAPQLLSPADSATGLTGAVPLQWQMTAHPALVGFRVEVRRSGQVILDGFAGGDQREFSIPAGSLTGSTDYEWRIGAVAGEYRFVTWTPLRRFRTGSMPPPQSPLIAVPRYGAHFANMPLIRWDRTDDTLSYDLEIHEGYWNGGYGSLFRWLSIKVAYSAYNLPINYHLPTADLPVSNGPYLIQVRARNSSGAGPWSSWTPFWRSNGSSTPRVIRNDFESGTVPRNRASFWHPLTQTSTSPEIRFELQVARRGDFEHASSRQFSNNLLNDSFGERELYQQYTSVDFDDAWPGELLAWRVRAWDFPLSTWTPWSDIAWTYPDIEKKPWPASPLNASLLASPGSVPFNWACGYPSYSYPVLQITKSSDPTFSTPVVNFTATQTTDNHRSFFLQPDLRFITKDASQTSTTLATLQRNVTYLWRVKLIYHPLNPGAATLWSATSSFTPTFAAPTLSGPAEGTSVSVTSSGLALSWSAIAGATRYDIEFSDRGDFSTLLAQMTSTTATATFQIPNGSSMLAGGSRFYWRVRAAEGAGAGLWSEARTLILQLARPTTPLWDISYSGGLQPEPAMLRFPFFNGSLTHHYELELEDARGNIVYSNRAVAVGASGSRQHVGVPALKQDMTYLLRLRGINTAGAGDWAVARISTLNIVRALSPRHGAHLPMLSPRGTVSFDWGEPDAGVSASSQYEVAATFTDLDDANYTWTLQQSLPTSPTEWSTLISGRAAHRLKMLWKVRARVGGFDYWTPEQTVWFDGRTVWANWEEISGSSRRSGWRMVTVPLDSLQSVNSTDLHLNPAATIRSPFYRFEGGYKAASTLRGGEGYWVKTDPGSVALPVGSAAPAGPVTIPLRAGWNMIGNPFDVEIALPIPLPDPICSEAFAYRDDGYGSAGYELVWSLRPWEGCWIKASASGAIVLTRQPMGSVTMTKIPDGREVPLSPSGGLIVTGGDALFSGKCGSVGGTATYLLKNTGTRALSWKVRAMKGSTWLRIQGTAPSFSGTLDPGIEKTITVNLGPEAQRLDAATYTDTLAFVNETDHSGDSVRAVRLSISAISKLPVIETQVSVD